jgi:hypothetical protein
MMKDWDSYDSVIKMLLELKENVEEMRKIVGDDAMTFHVLHTLQRMEDQSC